MRGLKSTMTSLYRPKKGVVENPSQEHPPLPQSPGKNLEDIKGGIAWLFGIRIFSVSNSPFFLECCQTQ